MKIKDIKGKGIEELQKTLTEKREALRNFRYGITGSKTRNLREGRGLRRDIAKILTVLNSENK